MRPILQAHCVSCHGGARKVRGGLRLTSRETLLQGGDTNVYPMKVELRSRDQTVAEIRSPIVGPEERSLK